MAESTVRSHPPGEERVAFAGPAGRLEGRWRPAAPGPAPAAALLCHPHPLHGGSLRNKTLYRLAKGLSTELAVPSLRWNFRGVGRSEGVHDGGRGERKDADAALAWLRHRVGTRPLLAVGYSFGAAVGLRAATDDPQVCALIALGLPLLREWRLDFLLAAQKPLLVVQGQDDEFGSPPDIEAYLAPRSAPTRVEAVPDCPHVFGDHSDAAVSAVLAYTATLLSQNTE